MAAGGRPLLFPGRVEMNEVRDGIWLGSARAESAPLDALQRLGISHIVQVGSGDFMQPSHPDALRYCCVPAIDYEGEDLLAKLQQARAHAFIDEARSNGGKVLVHCFAGVSRSATTVITYLMSRERLAFEQALADVIAKRGCVAPNRGFCDQMRLLQAQCGGELDAYRPQMLQDWKEGLTIKQWLGLLMRAKERAGCCNGEACAPAADPAGADSQRVECGDLARSRRSRPQQQLPPPAEEVTLG